LGGGVARVMPSPASGRTERLARNGGAEGLAGRRETRVRALGGSGLLELLGSAKPSPFGRGGTDGSGSAPTGSSNGCVGRESSTLLGSAIAVQETARIVTPAKRTLAVPFDASTSLEPSSG
jgi:hypothetical protein